MSKWILTKNKFLNLAQVEAISIECRTFREFKDRYDNFDTKEIEEGVLVFTLIDSGRPNFIDEYVFRKKDLRWPIEEVMPKIYEFLNNKDQYVFEITKEFINESSKL